MKGAAQRAESKQNARLALSKRHGPGGMCIRAPIAKRQRPPRYGASLLQMALTAAMATGRGAGRASGAELKLQMLMQSPDRAWE